MISKMMRNFKLSLSILAVLLFTQGCATPHQSNKQRAAELRMEIGISHIQRNNLPLALKELLGALELDPKNSNVHNNLGIVYYLREKFDISVKYFLQAIALNPSFTEAKNNLARVYIVQNNIPRRLTFLMKSYLI